MRKKALAILLTTSILALTACGGGSSNLIVETNSGNVSKDEFYDRLKERYGAEILQELVFEKILEDKYDATEEEISLVLQDIAEQSGGMLDTENPDDELKDYARKQALSIKLLTKDITITEDELKEYYDNIKPEINARHILVEDEKEAKKLKKQLDEGADFAKLAEEKSTDQETAVNGGELGWFGQGKMTEPFEKAAYKLKKDEISEPVKSDFGWHIIQRLDTKEKASFDEMKNEIEFTLKSKRIDNEAAAAILEAELKEANVKVKEEDLKYIFQQLEE